MSAPTFLEFASRRRLLLLACALVGIVLPALLFYDRWGDAPGNAQLGSLLETLKGSGSAILAGSGISNNPDDAYVAVCLAIRNQAPDLPEWLQHHYYNMGIRKFYIMDDGSSPPVSDFLDTYPIPAEAIEFHYYDESERIHYMQAKVYDECIAFGQQHGHTWMAFIDADEYFDTPGSETINEVLKSFEPIDAIGAVGVNWRMHTSNGQLIRANSVMQAYTECIYDDPEDNNEASDNKHIKSIVRLAYYESMENPHKFYLKQGAITVGEHGDWIEHYAFRQPITRDRLALHHYAVKSRQEYEEKISRGNAMSDPKDWGFWNHVEEMPHVHCPEMLRWVK
ncbi:Glycosyltranserase family 2 [Pleurostoma richardsiae]|uniref:Glycosyltranserase family 2 n=1 Tax=Pleurostoma richardsiae TaxID=41990 RepID=A0AA38S089_9PEZI|nr:Glycosyltranserase family 2 [Pleurostoma richardsiae]